MKNFYEESLYRNLGARINRPHPPLISFKELATLLGVSEAALGGKLSRVGAPKPVLINSTLLQGLEETRGIKNDSLLNGGILCNWKIEKFL